MRNIPAIFGSMVFNDKVMREKLPPEIYEAVKVSIDTGKPLELEVANAVAAAMKDWAIEKGVTHFTHWFQPMTGITAEKHDSFIKPKGDGVIMDFSGKSLVQGEPDASSFPSGGLRATFEARGYTAWDPSSYAFIKNNTLCIPTAFCAYNGQVLDKKTPLLRSMQALNKQALRILKLFGHTNVKKVNTTVGAEQEYFLIDKSVFEQRLDLLCCGRTLFGSKPPKGQEMDDHYFGAIKPRVAAFMQELDEELWKLGVLAKTKHNEVAPAQHELAPIFTTTNIATDHNQITMELMKSIAPRHGMACLLHEKPFAGVNGSGKHNNWSLSTDTGINLLEPGDTPDANAQFLLFLTAVIKAVDEYQDLLRMSAASAGNDHRLGANEAPPAIVSMFLGDELTEILEALCNGNGYSRRHKKTTLEIGVDFLPLFPKDTTDRNRTSPFAFTGNKFEFRMPGSSFSISGPNIVLNTIVADALCEFADELENSSNFTEDLNNLIKRTVKAHKRIIFNGNNYSEDWVREAEKRGLKNFKSTIEVLPCFIEPKNVAVFTKHGVLSEAEIHSRYEILLENYSKVLRTEALTMIEMSRKQIIPSVISYEKDLAATVEGMSNIGLTPAYEKELLRDLSLLLSALNGATVELERKVNAANGREHFELAKYYHDEVLSSMNALRAVADELETKVAKKYWAFPTYTDLLYSVRL